MDSLLDVCFEELNSSSTQFLIRSSDGTFLLSLLFLEGFMVFSNTCSTLCFEIANNCTILPTKCGGELTKGCNWTIFADCNDSEGSRNNKFLGCFVLLWNTFIDLKIGKCLGTPLCLIVDHSTDGAEEHFRRSALMEWTIAWVRVCGLMEETAELMVVEAMITVCNNLLRANNNNLLSVE